MNIEDIIGGTISDNPKYDKYGFEITEPEYYEGEETEDKEYAAYMDYDNCAYSENERRDNCAYSEANQGKNDARSKNAKAVYSEPDKSQSRRSLSQRGHKPWRFQPGQSGNPRGMPSGIKRAIKLDGQITEDTLKRLEKLNKGQLIELIKKVGGAIWGIGLMSTPELASAMKLKMAYSGLKESEAYRALPPIKEWLDRELGKAKQQIEHTGKDGEALSIRLMAVQERLLKDVTPLVIDDKT